MNIVCVIQALHVELEQLYEKMEQLYEPCNLVIVLAWQEKDGIEPTL